MSWVGFIKINLKHSHWINWIVVINANMYVITVLFLYIFGVILCANRVIEAHACRKQIMAMLFFLTEQFMKLSLWLMLKAFNSNYFVVKREKQKTNKREKKCWYSWMVITAEKRQRKRACKMWILIELSLFC